MVTAHSIDLTRIKEPCFAGGIGGGCKALTRLHKGCGSYKCPFYKPTLCMKWVRLGNEVIPPEELTVKEEI